MLGYQILEKCHLHSMAVEDASLIRVVEFFADHHGQYLYVYSGENLISVVTEKDIGSIVSSGFVKFSDRAVVWRCEAIPAELQISRWLAAHRQPYRVAVIVDGHLEFEVVATRPYRNSRGRMRCDMAVMSCAYFSGEVAKWFCEKDIRKIIVVGDFKVYKCLGKIIQTVDLSFAESFPEGVCSETLVLDCRYYDLLKYVPHKCRVLELSDILIEVVLCSLTMTCKNNGVSLYVYCVPSEDRIHNLTPLESRQIRFPREYRALLNDDVYVKEFSGSEEEADFLRRHPYESMSLVCRDGLYVQGDVNSNRLYVKGGVRMTLPNFDNPVNRIYVLGACTVFGLCVPDDKTIPSFIQQMCIERNLKIGVVNCGCLQGRSFVLNTLLRAYTTPVRKGDKLILMDSFVCNAVAKGVDAWINESKTCHDQWFFDSVLHCNAHANRCMAAHICSDCVDCDNVEPVDVNTCQRVSLLSVKTPV